MLVYDKFAKGPDGTYVATNSSQFESHLKSFAKKANAVTYHTYFPPDWKSVAEENAEKHDSVEILAAFKQTSYGIVYLVKWPDAPSDVPAAVVPSLALRKNHVKAVVDFYLKNALLPKITMNKLTLKVKLPVARRGEGAGSSSGGGGEGGGSVTGRGQRGRK